MGWPIGAEAVMLALKNTATLYLAEELTYQNSQWNDPLVVPPLVMPRVIFSEQPEQVRRLPALVFQDLGVGQRLNGALGAAGGGWAEWDYQFSMVLYFRADKIDVGQRIARRYNSALARLIMRRQSLDGSTQSPSGIDLIEGKTRYSADAEKAMRQLTFYTGWRGVIHLGEFL